ncbi:redoxin domain-containing protein [Zunongwangia sp.]|uniref:redoxin domain-containing protein n=1 Tax=Zunongwangia sp. TaxID=1965325 RepID=UPI003AA83AC1
MKKKSIEYFLFFIMIAGVFSCNHNKKQEDFTAKSNSQIKKNLDSLANLKTEEGKKALENRLKQLSKTDKESKVMLTYDYFYKLNQNEKVDSLSAILKQKFPNGISARFAAYQEIFSVDEPDKEYELYKSWKEKFPPKNYDLENQDLYNMGLYFIMQNYAKLENYDKIEELSKQLIDNPRIVFNYYNIAEIFYKKNKLDQALDFLKKTLNKAKKWSSDKKINNVLLQTIQDLQIDAYFFYAKILAKQEKYEEAITYFKKYKRNIDYLSVEANLDYADCLEATGNKEKAFEQLDEIIKNHGEAYEENYERFRRLFIETKGSQEDFKNYEKQLASQFQKQLEEEVAKEMVSEPAPNVTLVDLDNNKINLSDLKGKILILDFWATWCHPCKASFPAMQNIKKRYENDTDVKFLFINTMETQSEAIVKREVNKFLTANNYQFDVYKDPKSDSNTYPIAKAFKVQAIPFKFIIDKEGVIQYKIKGYEGNLKSEEAKLTAMIEMVKQKS